MQIIRGYAVGYGYNPTQNSQQYNKSILIDYAGVDEATQQKIFKMLKNYRNPRWWLLFQKSLKI